MKKIYIFLCIILFLLFFCLGVKKSLSFSNHISGNSYPTKYDLRNVNGNNYVSPVKDQGVLRGLSWAFAYNAALESNLLVKGLSTQDDLVTFSERQLDYFHVSAEPKTTALGTIDFFPFKDMLSDNKFEPPVPRGLGTEETGYYVRDKMTYGFFPVQEQNNSVWSDYWVGSTNSETRMNYSDVFNQGNVNHLIEKSEELGSIVNYTTEEERLELIDNIKEHIMNYGAVWVRTVYFDDGNYGFKYSDNGNDEVLINWHGYSNSNYSYGQQGFRAYSYAIIGWDDDYSQSYCVGVSNSVPYSEALVDNSCVRGIEIDVNGAWIVKNSQGDYYPYAYLAYSSYIFDSYSINSVINKDWDKWYNEDRDTIYFANKVANYQVYVFAKDDDTVERIKRLTFYIGNQSKDGETVDVWLDENNEDNYVFIGSLLIDHIGAASLDIDVSDHDLTSDRFTIKLNNASGAVWSYGVQTEIISEVEDNSINVVQYKDNYNVFILEGSNISTGTKVVPKIFNSSGVNVTSSFTVNSNPIFVDGRAKVKIDCNGSEEDFYGYYDVKFYDSNNNYLNVNSTLVIKPEIRMDHEFYHIWAGSSKSFLSLIYYKPEIAPYITHYFTDNKYIVAMDSSYKMHALRGGITDVGIVVTWDNVMYFYPVTIIVEDIVLPDSIDYDYNDNLYIDPLISEDDFIDSIDLKDCTYQFSLQNNYLSTGNVFTVLKNNEIIHMYNIIVMGDVNGDGKVTISDVSKVYNHFRGNMNMTEDANLIASDVNGDDLISISDVSKIYNYYRGNINSLREE